MAALSVSELAGTLVTEALRRVRDEAALAHSRNDVRNLLDKCQRIVNAFTKQVYDTQVVTLTPTSTGQWFYRYVWNKADVIFLSGRLMFEGETTPYPKDCMSCRYGDRATGGVWLWDWRTDEMIPLALQRPEAWICGKCGKARVNAEGQLIVGLPGSMCAACAAGDRIIVDPKTTKAVQEIKADKAAKVVKPAKKPKGNEKQLGLIGEK